MKINTKQKPEKLMRKSLLNKSNVEYADYAINHVQGCSHGCTYCYAMTMCVRFGKVRNYDDWVKPKLVGNALELLEKEIPKLKGKIDSVFLSFLSDPFMHDQPEITELSLKIIERLNRDNIRCVVLTKGDLPLALADKQKYGSNNEYGITLISLDEMFREQFEPGTSPYAKRIDGLKRLHDKGLKTWVSMEPYPTENMIKQDITTILNDIKFVDKIVFGRIHYDGGANKALKEKPDYYRDLSEVVRAFCSKNKIGCYIKNKTK